MSAQHTMLALLVAASLAACSSPQSRIEADPTGFAKLPAEQQALIREGKVAVGFDEAAVKLALGDPDRITQRTDTKGKSTIWRYVRYENDAGALLYTGYYHAYYAPLSPLLIGSAGTNRREYDRLRVIFSDGKVSAVEEELK